MRPRTAGSGAGPGLGTGLGLGLAGAVVLAWTLIAVGAAQAAAAAPAAQAAVEVAKSAPTSGADGVLQGDPAKGKELYSRCIACHALAYDRTGPRHCGLLGRRAGAIAGFSYSKAMKDSGIVWTRATLDTFLANPMKALPGTYMGYAGVTDRQERADLVAYLAQASAAEECRQ